PKCQCPGLPFESSQYLCSLYVSPVCRLSAARHATAAKACAVSVRYLEADGVLVASDVADVPPVARTRVDDDYLTVTMLSAGLAGILRRRSRVDRGDGRS